MVHPVLFALRAVAVASFVAIPVAYLAGHRYEGRLLGLIAFGASSVYEYGVVADFGRPSWSRGERSFRIALGVAALGGLVLLGSLARDALDALIAGAAVLIGVWCRRLVASERVNRVRGWRPIAISVALSAAAFYFLNDQRPGGEPSPSGPALIEPALFALLAWMVFSMPELPSA